MGASFCFKVKDLWRQAAVKAAQHCEHTQSHSTGHFTSGNFVAILGYVYFTATKK